MSEPRKNKSAAASVVLGGKKSRPDWEGTTATGFVTAKENKPPRQCSNCEYMKKGSCYNRHVKADPNIPNRAKRLNKDGSIQVAETDCCNYMSN